MTSAEQNAWLAEVAEWIYGCTINPNRRRDLCDLLTLVREQQATMRDLATKAEGLRREHDERCRCHSAHPDLTPRPCDCGTNEANALLDEIIAGLTPKEGDE